MPYSYEALNALERSLSATGVISKEYRSLIMSYAMGVAQEAHAAGRKEGRYEGEFETDHKDTLISRGIVAHEGSLGGQPRIYGTRITAEMVANLLSGDQPMSSEAIRKSYPSLSWRDIDNVKRWDKEGRPGLKIEFAAELPPY